jgi:hypothetical protein
MTATLLGTSALAQVPAGESQAGTTMAVTSATGTPKVAPPRRLNVGTDVFQNELIETDATGQVQLVFLDGSAFTMGPNGQMTLDELVYDPSTQKGALVANVVKGSLRFVGGRLSKEEPVTIKTPVGTIGIRGGIGIVSVGPGGSTDASFLFGRSLTLTNSNGQTVTITRPGFAARINPNGSIDPPRRLTVSEIQAQKGQVESGGSGGAGEAGGSNPTVSDNQVASANISGKATTFGTQTTVDVTPTQQTIPVQTNTVAQQVTSASTSTNLTSSLFGQYNFYDRVYDYYGYEYSYDRLAFITADGGFRQALTNPSRSQNVGLKVNFYAYNLSDVLGYNDVFQYSDIDVSIARFGCYNFSCNNVSLYGVSRGTGAASYDGLYYLGREFGNFEVNNASTVNYSDYPALASGTVSKSYNDWNTYTPTGSSSGVYSGDYTEAASFKRVTSSSAAEQAKQFGTRTSRTLYGFAAGYTVIRQPGNKFTVRRVRDQNSLVVSTDATSNRMAASMVIYERGSQGTNGSSAAPRHAYNLQFGSLNNNAGFSAFLDDNNYAATETRSLSADGGSYTNEPGASTYTYNTGSEDPETATSGNVTGSPLRSRLYFVSSGTTDVSNLLPSGTTLCKCDYLQWGWWGGEIDTYAGVDTATGEVLRRRDRFHLNTWVAGVPTELADLPLTGTASFTGHAIGTVVRRDGDFFSPTGTPFNSGGMYLAAGTASLNYNFGSGSGTFAVSNFDGMSASTTVNRNSGTTTFGSGDTSAYTTSASLPTQSGLQGLLEAGGRFYGPQAKNAGGRFYLWGNSRGQAVDATGIFAVTR